MYRREDKKQLTMDEFYLPFGGHLCKENRWVKMAKLMPWDVIEAEYIKHLCEAEGRPSLSARIAYGAIHIKEQENLTDEGTVEYLRENPYAQYFVGLKAFREAALFDASMMVHFRKRFPPEAIQKINEALYERTHPKAKNSPPDSGSGSETEQPAPLPEEGQNEGTLILDATVAPSDIRYPSDLGLLNECRENTEKMIAGLWEHTDKKGHKTDYSRKKARKSYMKIVKQRQPKAKAIGRAVAEQLEYVRKNLETLTRLLACVRYELLSDADLTRLCTICVVYRQQEQMLDEGKRRCEDRIVSLRQPHVRCIVRGKARARYEFGQKLHLSVVNGFTFVEHQSWDNFHEGTQLIAALERYRQRFGVYPKAILADKAYRNRENLLICKKHGIRLSGPRLGRPPKEEAQADHEQAYHDSCQRNWIEGRNGIGKRKYGLDLIMSVLPDTGMTEAALNVLVMNVTHLLRVLWRLLDWRCKLSLHRFCCVFITG